MALPESTYVSLELPSERSFALEDPVAFLARHPGSVILDEIQRAPELLSYIQVIVDEQPSPGRFLLTGSQNLGLLDSVNQSLAGRTGLVQLLPLDLEEMRGFPNPPGELSSVLWFGGYSRIHDQRLDPAEWLGSYTATYVERDVRSVLNIGDLEAFQTFLCLCAGRVGRLLNLSSFGVLTIRSVSDERDSSPDTWMREISF